MKSDKIYFRSKDRSARATLENTWPVGDLLQENGESAEEILLARHLAELSKSPIARQLVREAGEQSWRLGLARLDHHDFHLNVPEKTIILDDHGLDAESLPGAPYFYHAMQISLVRALRDACKEKRHGGFDENYAPESVLFLERLRAADCDVIAALVAWELRGGLWRHMTGSEDSDIALAFSSVLEKDPSAAFNGRALAAAFRQWFRNTGRVNACDHETLEYMDGVLDMNPGAAFGRRRAGKICVEVLSCMPDKTAYLRGLGEEILSDPLFAGLSDPINQAHFMQVMRDAEVCYVQNVPFRDAKLAARIFPGGRMTPEREEVKSGSR